MVSSHLEGGVRTELRRLVTRCFAGRRGNARGRRVVLRVSSTIGSYADLEAVRPSLTSSNVICTTRRSMWIHRTD